MQSLPAIEGQSDAIAGNASGSLPCLWDGPRKNHVYVGSLRQSMSNNQGLGSCNESRGLPWRKTTVLMPPSLFLDWLPAEPFPLVNHWLRWLSRGL